MVSNPAQVNNRGLIKTANIMLAVIQDLVSVQVITSCAVKLSCWPDSFILSNQGDGELLLLFEKGRKHRPSWPGGVIYLSRGVGGGSIKDLRLLLSCTVVVTLPKY